VLPGQRRNHSLFWSLGAQSAPGEVDKRHRARVDAGSLPTHPGLLLDAPQWPSESSQGNHLLFFRFAQDVAHIDEGYMPHAEINVPGLILVGRFSGDPHWPVLGDP
jgi:hypothetical protein